MKNAFFSLLMLATFGMMSSFTTPPPGCNDNHARGAAMSDPAFRDCVQGWNGWPIDYSVYSYATEAGCVYEVSAVACPPCRPNGPCIEAPCVTVSVATLDQNFNVISVNCNY